MRALKEVFRRHRSQPVTLAQKKHKRTELHADNSRQSLSSAVICAHR